MIVKINSVDNRYISKNDLFSISYPDLIEKINSIIDWDKSSFPEEIDITSDEEEPKLVENRKILGDNPALKENVVFYFKDQLLFVVDKDTLGLVNTDTGVLGLIRIVNDFILPEYKIRNSIDYLEPLKVEKGLIKNNLSEPWLNVPVYAQFLNSCKFTKETIDEKRKYGEPKMRLPYFLLEFLQNEFPELKENKMTVVVNSPEFDLFDVTLEITPTGKVYYDEDEFADDTHVRAEILSLLAGKMN